MSSEGEFDPRVVRPADMLNGYAPGSEYARLPYITVTLGQFVARQALQSAVAHHSEFVIPFQAFNKDDWGRLIKGNQTLTASGDRLALTAFIIANPNAEFGARDFSDAIARRTARAEQSAKVRAMRAGKAREYLDDYMGMISDGPPNQRRYRFTKATDVRVRAINNPTLSRDPYAIRRRQKRQSARITTV